MFVCIHSFAPDLLFITTKRVNFNTNIYIISAPKLPQNNVGGPSIPMLAQQISHNINNLQRMQVQRNQMQPQRLLPNLNRMQNPNPQGVNHQQQVLYFVYLQSFIGNN